MDPTRIIAVRYFATSRTRKEALGFGHSFFFVFRLGSFGKADRMLFLRLDAEASVAGIMITKRHPLPLKMGPYKVSAEQTNSRTKKNLLEKRGGELRHQMGATDIMTRYEVFR